MEPEAPVIVTKRRRSKKPRKRSAALLVVDGGAHHLENGEKMGDRDDATGRFVPGYVGGPGRPPGSRNKVTPLRQAFASAFDKLGGEAMLLKVARRYPRDFLALAVRLEPRLFSGDIDVSGPTEPAVRVVLPWNGRCDSALLAGVAHQETETECVLRIVEEVERLQQRNLAANGHDCDDRRRWFNQLMSLSKARIDAARAEAKTDNGDDDD
jgi:hypothetical protein